MYDCCQMEQSQNIINRIGPTVAPPANCSPLLLLAVQSVAITGDPPNKSFRVRVVDT